MRQVEGALHRAEACPSRPSPQRMGCCSDPNQPFIKENLQAPRAHHVQQQTHHPALQASSSSVSPAWPKVPPPTCLGTVRTACVLPSLTLHLQPASHHVPARNLPASPARGLQLAVCHLAAKLTPRASEVSPVRSPLSPQDQGLSLEGALARLLHQPSPDLQTLHLPCRLFSTLWQASSS